MQLDDFVLFLDENLQNCKPILDALAEHSVRVELHQSRFSPGENDEVWLAVVAEYGWVALTKDKRNRYNDLEKAAITRYRVREFYFAAGNMNRDEMALALRKAIDKMREIVREQEPPLIASITRSGTINILYDKDGPTHERRRAKAAKA